MGPAGLADVSRHGEVNGWCRVEGIPLKADDCPDCLASTVTLHRVPGSAPIAGWKFDLNGVTHYVVREHDGGAPTVYRWSVRRGSWAQHAEVVNETTLRDVRLWAALHRQGT